MALYLIAKVLNMVNFSSVGCLVPLKVSSQLFGTSVHLLNSPRNFGSY